MKKKKVLTIEKKNNFLHLNLTRISSRTTTNTCGRVVAPLMKFFQLKCTIFKNNFTKLELLP